MVGRWGFVYQADLGKNTPSKELEIEVFKLGEN